MSICLYSAILYSYKIFMGSSQLGTSPHILDAIKSLEWLDEIDLSGIVSILTNSHDPQELWIARGQVRSILDRINIALVRTYLYRQAFMWLIAQSKKEGDPILQLEREWEVINAAGNLAKESEEDINYAEMLVWMITAAAKDKQRKILWREHVFVKEELSDEDGRKNLLALTEEVAPHYDSYWEGFSATRLTRNEELARINWVIDTIQNRDVAIDLGTANGSVSRELIKKWFKTVHGYDVSPAMIREANKLKTHTGEVYTQYDLSKWIPHDNSSVDFVVASFGSAWEVHSDIISEVSRVLKPGWKAWLSFYNKDAFAHVWWQPQQNSLEIVYNPLAQIVEVPIKNNETWKMKVYKIPALSKSIRDIEVEVRGRWLLIDSVESFPLLSTMMPPTFFTEKWMEQIALEHDRAHWKVKPYRWYYLNVLLQKDHTSTF